MLYKALITDLDGTAVTLSSDGSDVTISTRDAVSNAQNKGIKIASATGRSWNLAKPVINALNIISPCIIEGGTRIIDPKSEKTLWEKHLEPAFVADILEIFHAHSSNGTFLSHAEEVHAPLKEVKNPPKTAQVMYLLGINADEAAAVCNEINERQLAAAHMTISWTGNGTVDVHVTHSEATKQHAIAVWQEIERVPKEQTIGMGDSGNDIPLFESVGLKVAVNSGTPELKALADYIAPNQSDDALKHVIDKFLLGKE